METIDLFLSVLCRVTAKCKNTLYWGLLFAILPLKKILVLHIFVNSVPKQIINFETSSYGVRMPGKTNFWTQMSFIHTFHWLIPTIALISDNLLSCTTFRCNLWILIPKSCFTWALHYFKDSRIIFTCSLSLSAEKAGKTFLKNSKDSAKKIPYISMNDSRWG